MSSKENLELVVDDLAVFYSAALVPEKIQNASKR